MNSKKNAPRYFMHKYWGKKPATGISPLVEKYTNPGDTIIDPFSGYGVFCCEAYLKNRNVIVNDLNPIANFIAHNLFSNDVNISRVKRVWKKIKAEMSTFINEWYNITIGEKTYLPISVLRNKDGLPLQFTFKDGRKTSIKDIPEELAKEFCEKENNYKITDWYPMVSVIENRLFVVLVDSTDMNQSWKMKRAFSLIEPKVNTYLDSFSENSLKKIEFTFNKKMYESLADIIFVVKE